MDHALWECTWGDLQALREELWETLQDIWQGEDRWMGLEYWGIEAQTDMVLREPAGEGQDEYEKRAETWVALKPVLRSLRERFLERKREDMA